jgi:hypothetical protein
MLGHAFNGAIYNSRIGIEPYFLDAVYSYDANEASGITGSLIQTLPNLGTSSGDFAAPSLAASPSLQTFAFGSNKNLNFDGVQDYMNLENSITDLAFINRTGNFHLYFVARFDSYTFPFSYPLASSETSSTVGWCIYTSASQKIGFILFKGTGVSHGSYEIPGTINLGQTYLIDISGDGTNFYFQINNGAIATVAYTNLPFNGAAVPAIASLGKLATDVAQDIGCPRLLIYPSKRSAPTNALIRANLSARYGMAV